MEDLTTQLSRRPTSEEWAAAVGLEPAELRRRITRGHHSKKAMISSNLRLVISVAKRYQNRGIAMHDLIQEGSMGLVRAVEKFDPEKGFKFSTYSTWWIKQSLLRSIADQSRTIRLPVHIHDLLNSIKKNQNELKAELGREASEHEVANAVGITPDKYRFIQDSSRSVVAMESTVTSKKSSSGATREILVGDFIRDSAPRPEDVTEGMLLKGDIENLVGTLSPREQDVIRMRFGLDAGKPKTLEEIGGVFSVTRERVRQIEARALHKLRQPYRNHKLREYSEAGKRDVNIHIGSDESSDKSAPSSADVRVENVSKDVVPSALVFEDSEKRLSLSRSASEEAVSRIYDQNDRARVPREYSRSI